MPGPEGLIAIRVSDGTRTIFGSDSSAVVSDVALDRRHIVAGTPGGVLVVRTATDAIPADVDERVETSLHGVEEGGVVSRLDEVRRELAAIQEELLGLDDDAFSERVRLRDRQHQLRQEVAELTRALPETRELLEKELERLEREHARIMDERINVAAAGHGDEAQGGAAAAQEVAFAMDRASGRREMEARMRRIRTQLRELRAEDGRGDTD